MPQAVVLKVRVSSGSSVGPGLPSSQAAVHMNIYSNVYSGTQNPSLKNREPEWGVGEEDKRTNQDEPTVDDLLEVLWGWERGSGVTFNVVRTVQMGAGRGRTQP